MAIILIGIRIILLPLSFLVWPILIIYPSANLALLLSCDPPELSPEWPCSHRIFSILAGGNSSNSQLYIISGKYLAYKSLVIVLSKRICHAQPHGVSWYLVHDFIIFMLLKICFCLTKNQLTAMRFIKWTSKNWISVC